LKNFGQTLIAFFQPDRDFSFSIAITIAIENRIRIDRDRVFIVQSICNFDYKT